MSVSDRRDRFIVIRVSGEEKHAIREKMQEVGSTNLSSYARKMLLDGIVVTLDLPELKEVVRLLRYAGNNMNQLARKANAGEEVYQEDVEDIKERFDRIYGTMNDLNLKLARLI